jgi:squalene synthase HpnC
LLAPSELEIAHELPSTACRPEEAERYTRRLATSHYENFNVVSWLLPRRLHQHFYNLYAYCRWADDLGDEIPDTARALELLAWWEDELRLCYAGTPQHPVFVALSGTIRQCDIPIGPFADLLTAFRQDQVVHRYAAWDDVLGYCKYSANPVGRLVLYLCGYRDDERHRLSDATCTALQLANFWQDVSRDLEKGRIYIPLDALRKHGLGFEDVETRRFDERYASLMRELIAGTRQLFAEGLPLAGRVSSELRVDIDMFSRGGIAVLDSIEAIGYNTLQHRPSIGKGRQARLLGRALVGRLFSLRGSGGQSNVAAPAAQVPDTDSRSVAESYDECRRIARNAASSFYPAFFLLPEAKRRGLCALYAFFRLLDDVSDDASQREQCPADADTPDAAIKSRNASIARWRSLVDDAYAGKTGGHPILPAFADTASRFGIPSRYFHDLISGSEMDLTELSYPTFDRLREYCYRVAGTVGLTCIHVFGFKDPKAPDLAETLGIAFQLTNILRDVPEDLRMGRVYIPQEDLQRFGVAKPDLAGPLTPALAQMMEFEADRAWQYYEKGAALISLLDRDSRGALWALARNYSSLLARIESRGYDVFTARVRLSTPEKLAILARAQFGAWSEGNVLEKRDRGRRRAGGAFVGRRAG